MQCRHTGYMVFFVIISMNAKLEKPKMLRNDEKKSVVYGVVICCECGGTDTALSKKGVYCNKCKSFRRFQKGKFELIPPLESYERFDDDD